MNMTLALNEDLEEIVKTHKHIKWTEIARNAIREEAVKLKKLELLEKHLEKKPISRKDWEWMNRIDWHPVDEMEYNSEFVKNVLKSDKAKARRLNNASDLLK